MINIKGLDKAAVLAALYNSAKVQGLGFLQAISGDMPIDQARELIGVPSNIPGYEGVNLHGERIYFDYVYGRVMKIDLTSDVEFDEALYDCDNGKGAAASAIAPLRFKLVNVPEEDLP